MEETNVSGGAQQSDVSDSTEVNQKTKNNPQDDYRKDMFKWKGKAKELQDKLAEYELKEQEQKGNLNEVILKLKEENRALRSDVATSRANFAEGNIENSVKRKAAELGCKDPNTFYKLIDKADISTIEMDSKFNAREDDIEVIIEKYKKNYEHLGFFKKDVKVVDKSPNFDNNKRPEKKKELDELTHEQLMELAAANGLKRINR